MQRKLHWGMISTYRQEIMGIACLWVVFHHNIFDWPSFLEPIRKLATYGNAGVDIFLFLSGISLYFAYSKKPQLGSFYKRRAIRLLIPYILLAVPYWIWKDIGLQKGPFLLDVTMLSFPLDGIITTWYVGAILLFYLAYPLIHKLYFETGKRFGLFCKRKCHCHHTASVYGGPVFYCEPVCPGILQECGDCIDKNGDFSDWLQSWRVGV